jgi:chemotaxis response regulator CheB
MPKAAIEIGAVTDIVHKDEIAQAMVDLSYKISSRKAS